MTETQKQQALKLAQAANLEREAERLRMLAKVKRQGLVDRPRSRPRTIEVVNRMASAAESRADDLEAGAAALRSQVQTERTPAIEDRIQTLVAKYGWTLGSEFHLDLERLAVLRSAPALTQGEHDHGGTSLTAGDGVSVSVPAPELPHDAMSQKIQ